MQFLPFRSSKLSLRARPLPLAIFSFISLYMSQPDIKEGKQRGFLSISYVNIMYCSCHVVSCLLRVSPEVMTSFSLTRCGYISYFLHRSFIAGHLFALQMTFSLFAIRYIFYFCISLFVPLQRLDGGKGA